MSSLDTHFSQIYFLYYRRCILGNIWFSVANIINRVAVIWAQRAWIIDFTFEVLPEGLLFFRRQSKVGFSCYGMGIGRWLVGIETRALNLEDRVWRYLTKSIMRGNLRCILVFRIYLWYFCQLMLLLLMIRLNVFLKALRSLKVLLSLINFQSFNCQYRWLRNLRLLDSLSLWRV